MKKKRRGRRKSTPGGAAGGAAGGKGYLLPFLRRRPRDGRCPQRSTGRRARRQESRGVAITISRTTFASRPTKVPAPFRGRRCDMGFDDPGLQPADPLRRHTEQQEINVIPTKTADAVHRNPHGAEERCPADLLGAPGVGVISKPVCK